MPKHTFDATEGLLRDVMTKQAGVIEKAWLEALMNGVDAGADEIHFRIGENATEYSDDGSSMTQDEVERYFQQFGFKDSDIEDKEFGKFRMGRGQIFNFGTNVWRAKENYMVVDIHNDQTTVELPDCTTTSDESVIDADDSSYTVDTSGLGYALLDAEHIDDGLTILVEHHDPLEDVDKKVEEFRKLARFVPWVHDVDLYINGEQLLVEPEIIEETELAWYAEGPDTYYNDSNVYNKGAYVSEYDLGPVAFNVISKHDLDVTLDRTDILDTDSYWDRIQDEIVGVTVNHLKDKEDLNSQERTWLMERAAESESVLKTIQDVPLVEDVDGDRYTLSELDNTRIGFAEAGNEVASQAMQSGQATMLKEGQRSSFEELAQSVSSSISEDDIDPYADIIEEELTFEMSEIDVDSLSKRRAKNLMVLRDALSDLGFKGVLKAGFSNHRTVWKNEDGDIYIHKDSLNVNKNKLATDMLQKLVIHMAHDGESMTSINEDYGLNRSFYKYATGTDFSSVEDMPTVQRRILNGVYN